MTDAGAMIVTATGWITADTTTTEKTGLLATGVPVVDYLPSETTSVIVAIAMKVLF